MTRLAGKTYDLEVRSVYMHTSLDGMHRVLKTEQTTGVRRVVSRIALEYNYAAQTKERVGRFEEDAPVALVIVSGFDARLALLAEDQVLLTVNGQPVEPDADADVTGYVGWEDVYRTGERSAVFPVVLTEQGGVLEFVVRVQSLGTEEPVLETARIQVELINTREAKPEKEARIVQAECEEAEVYIVGDRMYVDHPAGSSGAVKIRLRFADEGGARFDGITWALETVCKEADAQAALYLDEHVKLDAEGAAQYHLAREGAQDRREQVRFVLETKDALYRTRAYTIVERFGVTKENVKGICFAQAQKVLCVGETYEPDVRGIRTGEALCSDAFGALTLHVGRNADASVIDLSDGRTVIAVKPGTASIAARYESGGRVYEASMKIVVTEGAAREYTVQCKTLNVRAGASLAAQKIGRLHRGDVVEVLRIEDGWALLADGRYVCARYIA